MSRQWLSWDSQEHIKIYRQRLHRKLEKIATLKALLEMWEAHPNHDHAYILKLRAKLRSAEHQLEAMQP